MNTTCASRLVPESCTSCAMVISSTRRSNSAVRAYRRLNANAARMNWPRPAASARYSALYAASRIEPPNATSDTTNSPTSAGPSHAGRRLLASTHTAYAANQAAP